MVSHYKSKVIQVQKPAQSLQAFQKKVASGEDIRVGYLKPILLAAGIAVVGVSAFYGYRAVRASALEDHQIALADLQLEVAGDDAVTGTAPAAPQDLEKRMRDHLPQLEALARNAPAEDRTGTQSLLATWQVELGVQGPAPAAPTSPWGKLRQAQRQVALGQGQDATATLASLRRSADPGQAWAPVYWSTLLDADRLQGNRDQAWKDLAEYKTRFKQLADPSLERVLAGV